MLPKDFYQKVEDLNYLKHVLYSDTDSVYLCIPYPQDKEIEEKWNESIKISEEINESIAKYLKNYVFKLGNIESSYNKTDFKTESLMDSIVFLPDTKKYYAYKLVVDEGKFLSPAKIKYKNIGIKSNTAKMSSQLLQSMLDDVVLNSEISYNQKINELNKVVDRFHQTFIKQIEQYQFMDIGIPNKWNKAAQIINAMKVYNMIMNKDVFGPGSAGLYVYCSFKNSSLFQNSDIDLKNLNTLAVPYNYDDKLLKEKMEEYNIEVNSQEHWNRCIFTTTCHKVIQSVKVNK